MRISFKRITSSGSFIPEIDGLRFIAIISVVLYHLNGFLNEKYLDAIQQNTTFYSFLKNLLSHGHLGVPLFFVISGYILGLPFAKFHIANSKPINLKNYFARRLSRLEPPYILVMTLLFFAACFVVHKYSFQEGFMSYLASITYTHNFFYPGMLPKLNAVTWSLEVEIQFYILAPLMGYLFFVKPVKTRRLLLTLLTLLFLIVNHTITFKYISVMNYMQYFLIGFILADLNVSKTELFSKTKWDYLIGLCCFAIIWIFDESDFNSNQLKFVWEGIQLISIFFLYYYVLFHKIFKFLTLNVITNIGGMCYTIYLLHYPIISMFGNPLVKFSFSNNAFVNVSIYSILLLILIIMLSSLFFLLVERPCMDKDWVKKCKKKILFS
ncbi:acyltransferase [Flavobacterium amnicola]|uniref:Acyltransferase n=1 Tax=Flavobacterium amnicola TaxID=2506422 RepID=A0A4V1N1S6_9FLAO|nr:acyltransferase [Flavobacterium amnicola]RXR17785.1 acyltransferase [Flavobacterium amnicola]